MKRNTKTGSQHFLASTQTVIDILNRSDVKKSDTVYDIGAGSGVITSVLAKRVNKVIAVELDQAAVNILKRNILNVHKFENVEIIHGDYLKIQPPAKPYKIVSNIPFSISSEIVSSFFNSKNSPESAYLIVQKQFGQKLVSTEVGKFTSALGMTIGAEYSVRVIKRLNKTDFKPQPAVDTVCIELKKRKHSLVDPNQLNKYRDYTEKCFSDQKFMSKQRLDVIGATPGLSPSRLSLSQWIILFNANNPGR